MIHDRRCVKPELDNGKEIKLETGLNKAKQAVGLILKLKKNK